MLQWPKKFTARPSCDQSFLIAAAAIFSRLRVSTALVGLSCTAAAATTPDLRGVLTCACKNRWTFRVFVQRLSDFVFCTFDSCVQLPVLCSLANR
jgi:hypothetical protein